MTVMTIVIMKRLEVAQRRSERIVINVEPLIASAYKTMITQLSLGNPSEYGRKLIIDDLKECGMLTDEMIAKMMT